MCVSRYDFSTLREKHWWWHAGTHDPKHVSLEPEGASGSCVATIRDSGQGDLPGERVSERGMRRTSRIAASCPGEGGQRLCTRLTHDARFTVSGALSRAVRVRAELFNERVEAFKEWLLARPERVIAVVAHWGLINQLTAGADFRNCELRSFELCGRSKRVKELARLGW